MEKQEIEEALPKLGNYKEFFIQKFVIVLLQ